MLRLSLSEGCTMSQVQGCSGLSQENGVASRRPSGEFRLPIPHHQRERVLCLFHGSPVRLISQSLNNKKQTCPHGWICLYANKVL